MNKKQLENYCGNHGIVTATYQKAAELVKEDAFLQFSTRRMTLHVE